MNGKNMEGPGSEFAHDRALSPDDDALDVQELIIGLFNSGVDLQAAAALAEDVPGTFDLEN
ncbi:MAG: hypothetical protein KBF66_13505 [Rhodoferax sp.]|uniref:hypothetical protein n=1 Tax=Rhodoferax sp. TaxID=50421 RepID=UPI001B6B860C|nr:hypothetical protein [Rhodoferax sp.]MBP9906572.1 hypothetical protein [Rhodoferax sp.]